MFTASKTSDVVRCGNKTRLSRVVCVPLSAIYSSLLAKLQNIAT